MNLSFINKQKLACMWPENLRVMRPALENMPRQELENQSHSWCHQQWSNGLQTSLGLLISTCHQAGFISHCPDDRGSCKGYLTPCEEPSVLANRLLTSRVSLVQREQSRGKPRMRKGQEWDRGVQTAGHSQARASPFWRILGADLPLTPSAQ